MFRVEAIVPSGPIIDPKLQDQAVQEALDAVAARVQTALLEPTKSWVETPTFVVESPSRWIRDVFTTNKVYSWVNSGTPRHFIGAVAARALRFTIGGTPKTTPGVLQSTAGGSGTTLRFAARVNNPGITPRRFDEVVGAEYKPVLQATVQEKINNAIH